jgi:hypothetical protein
MILSLAVMLIFNCSCAYGQSPDSLITPHLPLDTLTVKGQTELDSIQNSAAEQFNSIRETYDSVMTVVSEQSTRVNREIDSLHNLNLPGEGLLSKLDSIEHWKNEKINALNGKVEELKIKVTEKVKTLDLPPELEEKGRELSAVMNSLEVSVPDAGIPLALQHNLQVDLPGLENPLGD